MTPHGSILMVYGRGNRRWPRALMSSPDFDLDRDRVHDPDEKEDKGIVVMK